MRIDSTDPAVQKLENILGREAAHALFNELCTGLMIDSLEVPQDRFKFGEALVKRGGVLEAIGRSIKVQALLRGAVGS